MQPRGRREDHQLHLWGLCLGCQRGNLAAAYRDAERTAAAITLCEQTLVAQERVLGGYHPDTVVSRSDLAVAYRDAERTAAAKKVYPSPSDP